MGGKSSHQPETIDNYKVVTFSELSLSNQINASDLSLFAPIPKEIVYLIISMLGPLNCWQLTETSRSLRNFFTHTVAYFSSKQKPDPDLTHLYNNFCSRFTFPHLIPQFLVLNNSVQLVEYEQNMHLIHGLVVNCSESLPLLDLPELPFLLISWPNYKSSQDGIKRSMDHISELLKSHRYPKVKRLVLKNLVCSSKLIEYLITKFEELEYLNIVSFNSNYNFGPCETSLSELTVLEELEITLPTLNDFTLGLPDQLKECTINALQQNRKSSCPKDQIIDASRCRSLKSL